MTTLDQIRAFLQSKKGLINLEKLGEQSGVSALTIRKFVSGEKYRYLTDAQVEKLLPVLIELGFKLKNE